MTLKSNVYVSVQWIQSLPCVKFYTWFDLVEELSFNQLCILELMITNHKFNQIPAMSMSPEMFIISPLRDNKHIDEIVHCTELYKTVTQQ